MGRLLCLEVDKLPEIALVASLSITVIVLIQVIIRIESQIDARRKFRRLLEGNGLEWTDLSQRQRDLVEWAADRGKAVAPEVFCPVRFQVLRKVVPECPL